MKEKTEQEEINEALDKLERERQERIKAGNPREDDDYAPAFMGFIGKRKKKNNNEPSS